MMGVGLQAHLRDELGKRLESVTLNALFMRFHRTYVSRIFVIRIVRHQVAAQFSGKKIRPDGKVGFK